MERIEFKSGGKSCIGDLFVPARREEGRRLAGLVIARGFGMVREASVELGRSFERAGFVVLSIDYRTFGESEGEPRGQLFPLDQVEDIRNAISYLRSRPEVDPDRIGIWGSSFGGGLGLYTAAVDRRVRAVVSQVPIVHGRRWMQAIRTAEQWEDLLSKLEEDRDRRYRGLPGERVKITCRGGTGEFCALPSVEQMVTHLNVDAKRSLATWRDDITLESVERVIEFDPMSVIGLIGPRPLLIIALAGYDVVHQVEDILAAYESARQPKELVVLPFRHLELDREPGRSIALGHAVSFFDRALRQQPCGSTVLTQMALSRRQDAPM